MISRFGANRFFLLIKLVPFFVATLAMLRAADFNVRDFGARGDGVTLDSPAINAAIEAAAAAGGGTVKFPAGRYLSFSIRLKSNLALFLDAGATILAAKPSPGFGSYDPAEPNEHDKYQDFGHSHWQNSLIWGIALENVSIYGSGRIEGTDGLTRRGPPAKKDAEQSAAATPDAAQPKPISVENGEEAIAETETKTAGQSQRPPRRFSMEGQGNKAIALKLCRNVILRDVTILNGGHMAVLATGVDNLTIDNLKVDTLRDGFDVDACRNVRISNCSVNSPHDDGICLKSSFGLGEARACENITITNCQVTGYDAGSFLDGTFKRTMERAPDRDGPTGRIKFGTESNGGFKNITISNCVFDRSRGLALETVDGGVIEDVTISNITMREVSNSPLFLRLGARLRAPANTPVGAIRRVTISNVVVSDADARYASIIAGVPGHPIEDVLLSNIRIHYRGGLTMQHVAEQPTALTNHFFQRAPGQRFQPGAERPTTEPRELFDIPEREIGYPEPSMFGLLPAYGLFVRHAKDIVVENVEVSFAKDDTRHAVVLMDVAGITFDRFKAQRVGDAAMFVLRDVRDFALRNSPPLPDKIIDSATQKSLP
ncbi:MAG: glycosyl hydrolase family 28-related protein [Nibricoccus sp.]